MVQIQNPNNRLELHSKLVSILGSEHVYFQPPQSIRMDYPCIRYSFEGIEKYNANNSIYFSRDEYSITVIDRNPNSEIPSKILNEFKYCRLEQHYVADNLHHFVFNLFY